MGLRTQFRGKKEWSDSTGGGINLNTASDEAAKNYDSLITQFCGWYQDEANGGMEMALKRMVDSDPEFVLGLAFQLQLRHMGALFCSRTDQSIAKLYLDFENLIKRKANNLTELELMHVEVVRHWTKNKLNEAVHELERIITIYPDDVSAIKMCQDLYFMLGPAPRMRNAPAYSLAVMSDKNPLKGYAHGIYSFALEESHMYEKSQQEVLKALKLIPNDTWAIHNYAHCLEMQGKVEEGLTWMKDKKCDWSPCQTLACHQYWHTALFHINNNNLDEAINLLDNEVLTRCTDGSTSLDFHDAASMVYRMELVNLFDKQGRSDKNRWSSLYEHSKIHKNDHLFGFNDAHYMMAFLGANDLEISRQLIDSIDQVPELIEGKTVVKPLLEAMFEFKNANYSKTVDLMSPIRFEILKIGGSHAQRDLFDQLLLVAALKSDKREHNKLGERMVIERDSMFGRHLPQTELLVKQKTNV